MKRYNLFLPEEDIAALQGIGERKGLTVSEQVREAVATYLKKHNHYPVAEPPVSGPDELTPQDFNF